MIETTNKIIRKKEHKEIKSGITHVHTTFNNTIITITDEKGNTINWASAGSVGFKGARRSTSYAAQTAAEEAGKEAINYGLSSVKIILKGIGEGRESAIRGIISSGLSVHAIEDRTPLPHNGCRPRKKRRV